MATNEYLQKHMWNNATGNFVRRADQPTAAGSDAWGITIVLDAYAYMVQQGFMKPEALKQYFRSSTGLYDRTGGISGARILARQGEQVYIGGDDELQWISSLAHCYEATHDAEYLNSAASAFNALVDAKFWIEDGAKGARGWAWNSADRRPNGVSTAYGALAAARLYKITGTYVYKWWSAAALAALRTPQVGFSPRDMMVASNAAATIYEVSSQSEFLDLAEALATRASKDAAAIISGTMAGEINPTDVGDLAEGYARLYEASRKSHYADEAHHYAELFLADRSNADIAEHGFASRYDHGHNGKIGSPSKVGAYLGVPLGIGFLPENAEMLKLCVVGYTYFK
jgi:hypothetical protein